MKHTLWILWAFALPAAYATPLEQQNELSEAQMRYQIVLKDQANDRSDFVRLQGRLKAAEKKLATAQLEVDKIRAELLLRQELQNANHHKLQEAGSRVNKAWNAVYGGNTPTKKTDTAQKPTEVKSEPKHETKHETKTEVKTEKTHTTAAKK